MEVVHNQRDCQVQTSFGVITLRRGYYQHTKAGTGRFPLDHTLDLVRWHMPGIARLICRASSMGDSYEGAAADFHAYLGLALKSRNFGRLVADVLPELRAAQNSLPAPSLKEPITDEDGQPMRDPASTTYVGTFDD